VSDTPDRFSSPGMGEVYGTRQIMGGVLGPTLLVITWLTDPPTGLSLAGWRVAGAAALMATWWISESVPIPITALIPLALFPLLNLGSIGDVATPYAHPIVFLFLGGFIIALAMQRWNLHRRIALYLIGIFGPRPNRIIAGFLLASCLISMWVSNTATTLMMLPIAVSILALLPGERPAFAPALVLAVAYGATTGGMATLIGTPPNALLAAYMSRVYEFEIGFAQWMLVGLPMTVVTLPVVYLGLTKFSFRVDQTEVPGMTDFITVEKAKMQRITTPEKVVALVFTLTALGWIFRPLLQKAVPMISDTSIAIAGAIALFLVPTNFKRGEFIMNWKAAKALPWDVLLLFGGGLSLASAIQSSGLATYLGEITVNLEGLPTLVVIALVAFGILLLTELTSNTATAATFLPIIGAIAVGMGHNPLLFLIPTAFAANCSYMMPVGTPPNAIVFGSGLITLPQMARTGLLLNILLVPVMLAIMWFLAPLVFDINYGVIPDWVRVEGT